MGKVVEGDYISRSFTIELSYLRNVVVGDNP
ncbi:unnamed protein product, partial [marine sediment metagenome]